MFKRVLIADDLNSITTGVLSALRSVGINAIETVHYCDDAYLKIKSAIHKNQPFDLLITDLSFLPDHRNQQIAHGEALAEILKKEHPELAVIVYSVEDRLQRVRLLIQKHRVNGYVCKGRNGLEELINAVQQVAAGQTYLSQRVAAALRPKTSIEIDDYDIQLLKQLANGRSQDEIAAYFKQNQIKPFSVSTIEKELQRLRIRFRAKNTIQLIANAKDLGII